MKIRTVNYTHGGTALELVAETEVEYMVLQEIWAFGGMTRGNGHSIAPSGHSSGFYLSAKPSQD